MDIPLPTKAAAFLLNLCLILPALSLAADRLFLTPYIDRGEVETARKLSEVETSAYYYRHIPESYAGYITVDKELKNHMFFWFFPSSLDPAAPLVVWLNGGPTVSSMFGLFYENGPLKGVIGEPYEEREFSWAKPFSMLYIDNPVGTGYSYTESGDKGYKVTQEGYTDDLYSFIEQFYKVFPEYYTREFYIGGQSYAGKYVPAMAYRIHTEIEAKRSRIPLTGIYLGGPYYDPPTESMAYFDYLYSLGAITYAQKVAHRGTVERMNKLFVEGQLKNTGLMSIFSSLVPQVGISSEENYVTGQWANYNIMTKVMTSKAMRQAVHAGDGIFHPINGKVYNMFGSDSLISTKPQLAELLNKYKVLIYSGDYDVIVSSVMVETALLSTPWEFQQQYNASRRRVWRSKTNRLKGFYSLTSKFCRVVVHGAGHQTPFDQPESSYGMMTDFVTYGCIKP